MPKRPPVHKPLGARPASSSKRGYNYAWQQARKDYLALHPRCEQCRTAGKSTLATVVDHIVPHRGDMDLFWDADNWQSLCAPCHGQKTRAGQ